MLKKGAGERPGALLARGTEEGMEPDDLPCSLNARPQKALVGRAQWKINQPPSPKRQRARLEGALSKCARSMRAVKGSLGHSPEERL